jgi:hypothetical protein
MNALDLVLEKEKYNLGEKVKGTLNIVIDSDTEIRSVKVLVLGIEKCWYTSYHSNSSQRIELKDIFFSKDIYNYIKSAATRLQSKKGKLGDRNFKYSVF